MLKSNPNFLTEEKEAPLLNLNYGYLDKDADKAIARASDWSKLTGLASVPEVSWDTGKEPDRIHIHDAERTFCKPEHRQKLIKILNYLNDKFGDYHQGLSYVTSFMLLTLPEDTVAAILTELNNKEKYIPGFWKGAPVNFGKDAHVFQVLMERRYPDVAQHLLKNGVIPTAYAQKWFVGLCVHVLPFESLFTFMELFLERGYPFLHQFGLSLVHNLKDKILSAPTATLFEYLRLDAKHIRPEQAREIVEFAKTIDLKGEDFVSMREVAFTTHIQPRLEAARKQKEEEDLKALQKKEKGADSDADSDFDSDDEGDDSEECQICSNMVPEYFCKPCGKKICEMCSKKNRGGHSKDHPIVPISDIEGEEITAEMNKLKI